MNEICRTCLQEISDSSVMFYLDSVDSHSETITIRCKLADCVPEMDLDVVPNAFICNSCFESLMIAHEFKNKCLETEGRIQSYIEQMGYVLASVDLREIVQQSKLQMPTINNTSNVSTSLQPSNSINVKDCSQNSESALYDSNKNSIKLKNDCEGKSLDLKNLQCDTKAFFAVPRIAQLLAEDGRNLHNCSYCDYKASNEFDLKFHEKTHHNKRLKICDISTVPNTKQSITEDNKEHECFYVTSNDFDLQSHTVTHHIPNTTSKLPQFDGNGDLSCFSLQCTQCSYKASSDLDLRSHEQTHFTSQKLHKCTVCDYSAPKRQTLIIHMRKHSAEKSYNCNKCNFKTEYRNMLVEHLKIHTEEKAYRCLMCNFKSKYSNILNKHIQSHMDESHKLYKCPLCDYSSSHKTNFNYHIRIHRGEKLYKCKLCKYKTSQKKNLVNHSKIHGIEYPFKCLRCNYTAISNKSLITHLQNHSNDKPYLCTFCSYNTCTKINLIKHIITHTGEERVQEASCKFNNSTRQSTKYAVFQSFCNDNNERHHGSAGEEDLAKQSLNNDNKRYCQEMNNCETAVKNEMII